MFCTIYFQDGKSMIIKMKNSIKLAQSKYVTQLKQYGLFSATVGLTYVDTEKGIENVTETLPEPPPVPDAAVELLNQFNELGEPTFASLGLGGWTPVGMVQQCFEYLHVTLGVPWWEAIAIGKIFIIKFIISQQFSIGTHYCSFYLFN